MTVERRLVFLEPSAPAFARSALDLLASVRCRVGLVGSGPLAEAFAQHAQQQGVEFEAFPAGVPGPGSGIDAFVLAEATGSVLGELLMEFVDRDAFIIAPRSDWYFDQRPLFLVSIPKAGTHLLYELAHALGYHAGVELQDVPHPGTWYCLEYGNSHTSAPEFFTAGVHRARFGNRHHPFPRSPTLFIYRHPFDVLVSEAHYYHHDGKSVFGGVLREKDFAGRVDWLLSDNGVIGPLADRLRSFTPWLEFPNVLPLSFEELVGAEGGGQDSLQRDLVWSIQLRLQAPGVTSEIVARVFNRDAATFRRGEIGAFRTELTPSIRAQLVPRMRDILESFGYDPGGEHPWPKRAQEYRRRVPRFSKSDFTDMPMLIESSFLGCNLVLYRRRYFAVPISAGSLALDGVPEADLGRLPWSDSLSDLKAVMLLGLRDYRDRFDALQSAGRELAGGPGSVETDRYWSDRAKPAIVEIRSGYNIVALHGRYIAISQSLGPVDLSEPLDALLRAYSTAEIIVSSSLNSIRDEIDGVTPSGRLFRDSLDPTGGSIGVTQALTSLDRRLSELELRISALPGQGGGRTDDCDATTGDNTSDQMMQK